MVGAVAFVACGDPGSPPTADGSATSTVGEATGAETGTSTSSVSATSLNPTSPEPTSEDSSSDGAADSTGSSTASAVDTTGSSTGSRCADGFPAVGRGDVCVGAPQIIDPQPAYDVVNLTDLYATVDIGVRRFWRDDLTAPPQDMDLGGRGQDILVTWLDDAISQPTGLLVTMPENDLLAVIPRDAEGRIGQPVLYPTGANPQRVGFLPIGATSGFVTANAGDGTLSRFASPGDGGPLVPMPAIDIGGSPHEVAYVDHYLGVVDPDAGVLHVLTLDEAFEVSASESYALEDPPNVLRPLLYSDVGPPAFLVGSAGADLVSIYAASTGITLATADYPGSPVGFTFCGFGGFFEGQGAMAVVLGDADRIGIWPSGFGKQFLLDAATFEVPTAADPVAVAVLDIDGDGALDFVTASPTSGIAVVLQQL